ncbi:hypothetical protein ACQKP8_03280 [Photobacterium alginatilyticum]|uniref:hypothetical protein n=1 Tax=Photobacterium alginatilyticum TaxID=1775171 RepID=UPI0040685BE3
MNRAEDFIKIDGLMSSYKHDSYFQKQTNKDRQAKLDTIHDILMTLANSYPNENIKLNMPELMASIQFIRDEIVDEGMNQSRI